MFRVWLTSNKLRTEKASLERYKTFEMVGSVWKQHDDPAYYPEFTHNLEVIYI